jgi:nucleoside-diphosphate-sugar epimerase
LCEALLARGDHVRALVRDATEAAPLVRPGVALLEGDITDAAAVRRGVEGADVIVHCAAILGGTAGRYQASDYDAVNLRGTLNVLDAASTDQRVVVLSTIAALQTDTVPVSEDSPIPDAIDNESPYTRSKRLALIETMRRAADGVEVCAVVPGGIYGPSPAVERALAPTSFNREICRAVRGELTRYARVPLPWSYAADVVEVIMAAAERGERGGRYLAMAAPEEAFTVGEFLTRACELAGVGHCVEDVEPSEDPAFDEEFAGMARLARRAFPRPLYDNRRSACELGVSPTPIDVGLAATIAWLRDVRAL